MQEQQLLELARTVVRQSQPASRPTLDRTVICPVCGKVGGGPYLKYAKKKADGTSYKYPAIFHQETGTWHTLSKKFLSSKVQELGLGVAPEIQPQPAAPRATAKTRRGPAEESGTPRRQESAATGASTGSCYLFDQPRVGGGRASAASRSSPSCWTQESGKRRSRAPSGTGVS